MIVHIQDPNDTTKAFCSSAGIRFPADVVIMHHRGQACLLCAERYSVALRGPDIPVDIQFDKSVFFAILAKTEPIIQAEPTCATLMNVTGTILQAAASNWLRFEQPEETKIAFPFNAERFSKLAGQIYRWLDLSRTSKRN